MHGTCKLKTKGEEQQASQHHHKNVLGNFRSPHFEYVSEIGYLLGK